MRLFVSEDRVFVGLAHESRGEVNAVSHEAVLSSGGTPDRTAEHLARGVADGDIDARRVELVADGDRRLAGVQVRLLLPLEGEDRDETLVVQDVLPEEARVLLAVRVDDDEDLLQSPVCDDRVGRQHVRATRRREDGGARRVLRHRVLEPVL